MYANYFAVPIYINTPENFEDSIICIAFVTSYSVYHITYSIFTLTSGIKHRSALYIMAEMATGTLVTTLPLELLTSDCDQLSGGRQSGSLSTSASLHVVWKSSHTCFVFSLGNCLWVVLQFLYLPVPVNHVNIYKK